MGRGSRSPLPSARALRPKALQGAGRGPLALAGRVCLASSPTAAVALAFPHFPSRLAPGSVAQAAVSGRPRASGLALPHPQKGAGLSPSRSGGLGVALFKSKARRVGRPHVSFQLQTLQSENSSLRRQAPGSPHPAPAGPGYADSARRPPLRSSRPMSMYETGSAQKPYLPLAEAPSPEEHVASRLQLFHTSRLEKQSSLPEGDYDNTAPALQPEEAGPIRKARQRSGPEGKDPEAHPGASFPSTEDVIRKTEQITKNIQELLRAAQESQHESYVPCSERIHLAVTEMAALFPKKPPLDLVRTPLRLLTSSAFRLHSECAKALPPESCSTADVQLVTQQVIQCAYDIAKAAKQLVTITTKENAN